MWQVISSHPLVYVYAIGVAALIALCIAFRPRIGTRMMNWMPRRPRHGGGQPTAFRFRQLR